MRRKLLWGAVAIAGVLSGVSMADAGGFRRYLELRQAVESLESRNAQLRAGNERSLREIEALQKDPVALERAAREELGFVKPGEIVLNME
ncbi:MAG: septum formation initiator family protein [Myxococcaceae bacterium]